MKFFLINSVPTDFNKNEDDGGDDDGGDMEVAFYHMPIIVISDDNLPDPQNKPIKETEF